MSFEEAITVFGDPLGRVVDDPENSQQEERCVLFGRSGAGRLLAVDADVAKVSADAKAVNDALRALAKIIEERSQHAA